LRLWSWGRFLGLPLLFMECFLGNSRFVHNGCNWMLTPQAYPLSGFVIITNKPSNNSNSKSPMKRGI
jgi:hypothetical protein